MLSTTAPPKQKPIAAMRDRSTVACFASVSFAALKRDCIAAGSFITAPESAPASFGLSAVLPSPYMSAMNAV